MKFQVMMMKLVDLDQLLLQNHWTGLAGELSLLRATGDVTGKNAGKEDLCGWAKDERTYEDYERLNLNEVVNIDTKFVTAKDLEFANREIKLD